MNIQEESEPETPLNVESSMHSPFKSLNLPETVSTESIDERNVIPEKIDCSGSKTPYSAWRIAESNQKFTKKWQEKQQGKGKSINYKTCIEDSKQAETTDIWTGN